MHKTRRQSDTEGKNKYKEKKVTLRETGISLKRKKKVKNVEERLWRKKSEKWWKKNKHSGSNTIRKKMKEKSKENVSKRNNRRINEEKWRQDANEEKQEKKEKAER